MSDYVESHALDRSFLVSLSLFLGSMPFAFLGLTASVCQIAFQLGITIGFWLIPSTFFLTLILGVCFSDFWSLSKRTAVRAELFFLILVAFSLLFSGHFYDLSWDGNDYQQRAIINLLEGWNPSTTELTPKDIYFNQEGNHYPKLPWITAAGISSIFGSIEYGKAPQLLLISSVFFLSLAFLLKLEKLRMKQVLVIAFLASFNPVSIFQSLSYFVDGWGSSTYISVFVLFLIIFNYPNKAALFTLFVAIITGLNIKFTFTVYISLLSAGFFIVYVFWWNFTKEKGRSIQLFQTLALSAMFGIGIAGYQPFVSNTLLYGNPLYPVIGGEEFNQDAIMAGQYPGNFEGKSSFEKFVSSIFSRTGNPIGEGSNAVLKVPFTMDYYELYTYIASDARVGGFGPLFSGIFLIAYSVLVANINTGNPHKIKILLVLSAIVAGTVLSNPEYWWARYVPQLWLFPLLVLVFVWSNPARFNSGLGWLLAIVMLVNVTIVGGTYLYENKRATDDINAKLSEMARSNEVYAVDFKVFSPWRLKLINYGIEYKDYSGKELPCKKWPLHLIDISKLNCQ